MHATARRVQRAAASLLGELLLVVVGFAVEEAAGTLRWLEGSDALRRRTRASASARIDAEWLNPRQRVVRACMWDGLVRSFGCRSGKTGGAGRLHVTYRHASAGQKLVVQCSCMLCSSEAALGNNSSPEPCCDGSAEFISDTH